MEDKTIQIVLMGGTIDSHWDATKDTAVANKKSIIPRYWEGLKLYTDVIFDEVAMKDSRDLTEKDLNKMADAVNKSKSKHVIVTHGTYTMGDSARYLEANLKDKDKTIIFTGSMVPIDGFTYTDGPFNLGYAFAKLESLNSGVYVAMNGRIFEPQEISKLISEGRFMSIYQRPKMEQR